MGDFPVTPIFPVVKIISFSYNICYNCKIFKLSTGQGDLDDTGAVMNILPFSFLVECLTLPQVYLINFNIQLNYYIYI